MNLKQQRKMVREYNLHRTQTNRLTAWGRFQLGVRLLVPTAITRLVAAIEHHDMPAAHVPRYGQAWEQLLPPTSASAKQWSGDVTLPIPSRLPAAMHWQDARLLCRIILGASSPSLAPLEQLYFRANLRYCFLAADDVYPLLGFVAAIDDLPRFDSGPVTLLLLHLSLLLGSKPALVQQRKAGMSSQAQQDSDALRQQLLAVRIVFINGYSGYPFNRTKHYVLWCKPSGGDKLMLLHGIRYVRRAS